MGGQGLGEKEIIGVRMLTDKGTGQFKGTAFIDLLDDKAFKVCPAPTNNTRWSHRALTIATLFLECP